MHRTGKWIAITLVTALTCTLLYPAVTPSIPINHLWYRITGSPGSAKSLAYISQQRWRNALHKGCGNGREVASQAMASLSSLAEDNSQVLNDLLSDPDPEIRGTIALAIGRVSNGWYRVTLEKMVVADSDRLVRLYACYALKEIGDKRSAPVLRSVLATETGKCSELRVLALWSLARLDDDPQLRTELKRMAKASASKEAERVLAQGPKQTQRESFELRLEMIQAPQHASHALHELGG